MEPADRRLGKADLLALLSLAALLALAGLWAFRTPAPPFEDAAILMRYADHMASGQGIVWNPGEPPVDGATDFLFLALAAGLTAAGLSVETAVRLLGLAALALTAFLVYVAVRRLHGAPVAAAWVSAAFLLLGPSLAYVEAHFGTPVFALATAVTWYLAYRLRSDPGSLRLALLFSLSALILGLIRPEGVFLAALMLAAVVFWAGWRRSLRAVAAFAAVFALLGGAFFLWRWSYFGHPLPTPFLKKGGGGLHVNGLITSVRAACQLCFPALLFWPFALRSRESLRRALFSWLPAVGFILLWVLLSDEMNFLMRFQFAVVPIVLISWPEWVAGLGRDLGLSPLRGMATGTRWSVVLFLAVATAGILGLQFLLYRNDAPQPDGRYDVARRLLPFRARGYTLVTSEAGLLPFYSRWRSIDAWGLNDPEIARHGISRELLERERPELIVYHVYGSPLAPAPPGTDPWARMITTLQTYAERHGYTLAASWGRDPFDTHYYFVRPDFPGAAAVTAAIRGTAYRWYEDGLPAVNYAIARPAAPAFPRER